MKEDGKQLLSALTFHEKSLKYEYVWKLFLKHKYRLDYQVCLRFGVVDPHFIKFFVLPTLFLSKKWSTTPNFTIKFGDVDHFIGNKRVGNTKFNHVGSSALAK